MSDETEWEIPASAQPHAGEWSFDLERDGRALYCVGYDDPFYYPAFRFGGERVVFSGIPRANIPRANIPRANIARADLLDVLRRIERRKALTTAELRRRHQRAVGTATAAADQLGGAYGVRRHHLGQREHLPHDVSGDVA